MTSIVVFDYGFGNVRSMVRALVNVGADVTLTSNHRAAMEADGVVVPGVGALAACLEGLRDVGGEQVIKERLADGRPVLGVCVGEQVMFESGVERGIHAQGLGLIGGKVARLDADVVPHTGWNTVQAAEGTTLLHGVEHERFYFVHSYAALDAHDVDVDGLGSDPGMVTRCSYGRSSFVAAYERGPLSATQFHPEKSAQAGARLLKNWIATFRNFS
ncbi:imidazole glycerol phosphate synthase subunit HisH [Bifidobacterium aquikefiricola]|uniref:Imidazole glycerol phosphate synthase subunit HisH n=1 Tax=Bifidobacterium aquikefiricola TaxID=3059038 RepID=A0AB39U8H6_9BIFI